MADNGATGGVGTASRHATQLGKQNISHPIGPVLGYPETGKSAWRMENDDVFTKAAKKFNSENGYSPSDPEYVTPGFMKAWAMMESGGDKGCFGTDPFQVNNSGDWTPKKTDVTGLSGRDQVMTPQTSADAALKWLQYKSTWPWGRASAPYVGRQRSLEFYNGSRNKESYAKKVLSLAKISFGVGQ